MPSVWSLLGVLAVALIVVEGLSHARTVMTVPAKAIFVSSLSTAAIFLYLIYWRSDPFWKRGLKVILCTLCVCAVSVILGEVLSVPICGAAGYIHGFIDGFFGLGRG